MKSTNEFLIKTNKGLYFLLLDGTRFEEISEWLAEKIYIEGKKGLKTKIGIIWNVEIQHYQNQNMEADIEVSKRPFHEIYSHPEYKYFCRHCGLREYDADPDDFEKVDCVWPNDYDVDMFKGENK